ncbi:unnamed protein product, partial [Mesorhabditis spiculigera]
MTLAAVTGFSILYKLPAFFEIQLDDQGQMVPTALRYNPTYQLYNNVVAYSILMLVIPWTIIIILNFIVILRVREAYGNRCSMAQHSVRRSIRKRDDAERRCTLMAVVMISLFFLCNFPSLINNFIETLSDGLIFRHRIPISNLLVCVNSATNILIYCVFNRKFRRAIQGLIGLKSQPSDSDSRKGVLERAGSYMISGFAVRMMAGAGQAAQWRHRSLNGSTKSTQTRFGDVATPPEESQLLVKLTPA